MSIENIIGYAEMFPEVMKALPVVPKEIKQLPREYIGNLVFTIVGDAFSKWVKEKVEKRNKKVADVGNVNIELDPEIADIF